MTPAEVRKLRLALGRTQGQMALLFGVEQRTWRRWEAEEGCNVRAIPPTAALLLRACVAMPALVQWLQRHTNR